MARAAFHCHALHLLIMETQLLLARTARSPAVNPSVISAVDPSAIAPLSGTHYELLGLRGRYARMWELQQHEESK